MQCPGGRRKGATMLRSRRLLQLAITLAVACMLFAVVLFSGGRLGSAVSSLAMGITDPRQFLENMTFSQRVTLVADGAERQLWTSAHTVQEALTAAGVSLGPWDRTVPALTDLVVDQQKISLIRVDQQLVEEQTVVPYRTVRVASRSMSRGESKEVRPGVNGKLLNTYQVLLENGTQVQKQLVSTVTLVEKQDRMIEEGTISTLSRGGQSLRYTKKLTVNASAYTSDVNPATGVADDPWKGLTSSGKKAVAGLTIATDPRVIPTGTRVYVEGIDSKGKKYSGVYVAQDTGGAIKGNKIDIFMSSYAECYSFGRRNMIVYILE